MLKFWCVCNFSSFSSKPSFVFFFPHCVPRGHHCDIREIRPDSDKEEMRCCVAGHAPPLNTFLNLICFSNANDILLFFREKLKMKEREEAWVKIENLAKANPQVLKKRVT